jgi:hypothetical protein
MLLTSAAWSCSIPVCGTSVTKSKLSMGTGFRRYDGLQCVGQKTVTPAKAGALIMHAAPQSMRAMDPRLRGDCVFTQYFPTTCASRYIIRP